VGQGVRQQGKNIYSIKNPNARFIIGVGKIFLFIFLETKLYIIYCNFLFSAKGLLDFYFHRV